MALPRFQLKLLSLLLLVLAVAVQANKVAKPFNCKGGSIYFAAHPIDAILYQNPDMFHDLYVFKCTTTVLFTSGNRGITGNFSKLVEQGFEDAFAYMVVQPMNDSSVWSTADIQLNGKLVLVRTVKEWPQFQIVYLRLPDSVPDGNPYLESGDGSLMELYGKKGATLTSIDGSARYTLDALKDLISSILQKRAPNDVHILDPTWPLPGEGKILDHADHSISARLVAEVMKRDEIKANLRAYACGHMHTLNRTLAWFDREVKIGTYFEYAKYDKHMCQSSAQCLIDANKGDAEHLPDYDDVQYTMRWLEREYYVK